MENDPLYQQGLKHFGLAQWSEAAACFTQLQVNHPSDPRIKQFLETARLRAAAGTGLQRSAQAQTRSTWLGVGSRLAALLILVGIGVAIYLAYQAWVVPAQLETARLARIDQLRQTADIQIASGQYADAAQTYQSILNEAPDDTTASAGLKHAQQLEQVAKLYAQATEALKNDQPAQAAQLLEQISQIDPNYRDTNSLLSQIQSTQALAKKFDAALQLQKAAKLLEAAQMFEDIRSTDRNFKPTEVNEALYAIYVQLGDQQLTKAGTAAEVETANTYYEQALSVRPLDARADTARRLASTFLDGAAAYQAKDWDTVIRKLSVVHEQEPGYFGGKVQQWLYEAYLTTGDAFMSKGDPFSARDRFRVALSLAITDAQKADAQKRYTAADKLTTPTPTPRPSPTPLPAGHVAPAWTLRMTGTPNPYPFVLINTTYLPNTITGEGCHWAGIMGRFFDRTGAPLVLETLGVRITGPSDQSGAAAGSFKMIGESGWIAQFDVRVKEIKGFIQVYYKDKPASDLIPYTTHPSCYENILMLDVQQVKALP
jgi:hypothetical protein